MLFRSASHGVSTNPSLSWFPDRSSVSEFRMAHLVLTAAIRAINIPVCRSTTPPSNLIPILRCCRCKSITELTAMCTWSALVCIRVADIVTGWRALITLLSFLSAYFGVGLAMQDKQRVFKELTHSVLRIQRHCTQLTIQYE